MGNKSLKIFTVIFPVVIVLGIIFSVAINRKSEEGDAVVPPVSYTPTLTPEVQPTVEVKSDTELIKEALVAKNGWDPSEISVTVSKNDGVYATGGAGSVTPGLGGGLWFAAKVNGVWKIVWDGNGVVMCESMADYPDYPTSLIPQCYNSTLDKMVDR